jgi:hypothetical protein
MRHKTEYEETVKALALLPASVRRAEWRKLSSKLGAAVLAAWLEERILKDAEKKIVVPAHVRRPARVKPSAEDGLKIVQRLKAGRQLSQAKRVEFALKEVKKAVEEGAKVRVPTREELDQISPFGTRWGATHVDKLRAISDPENIVIAQRWARKCEAYGVNTPDEIAEV